MTKEVVDPGHEGPLKDLNGPRGGRPRFSLWLLLSPKRILLTTTVVEHVLMQRSLKVINCPAAIKQGPQWNAS